MKRFDFTFIEELKKWITSNTERHYITDGPEFWVEGTSGIYTLKEILPGGFVLAINSYGMVESVAIETINEGGIVEIGLELDDKL